MNKTLLACLLVSILVLPSCNKKLFTSSNEKFHLNDLKYETLSIKSRMRYKGDENLRFTANIRMKKDSAVWFSLSPGFGIEAARGLVDTDSIVVIDKIHKEYSVRNLEQLFKGFNFHFEIGMIESIIIGNLLWHVESRDNVVRQNNNYVITQEKGDLRLISYVNSNSMKMEKLEAQSISTPNRMTIKFSNFEKQENMVYPKNIDISADYYDTRYRKEKNANITMNHSKVEIDQREYDFSISIPSKYALKN
ncbi:DUF4292 domain-containing protein [Reichenbachiella ulvae]|uniref:DUF4292 domain-containing protein n=1 Tax=Reichenbachiella ulvae TaxID=2980104 RepID=A0ABT3CWT3_9BACT|nr:DUF4292 domain-containing protein [Reichenbachiella ulvae]MCV9388013.1 DUF4292 domain-containing protein [Reichenbachiella ulvae]